MSQPSAPTSPTYILGQMVRYIHNISAVATILGVGETDSPENGGHTHYYVRLEYAHAIGYRHYLWVTDADIEPMVKASQRATPLPRGEDGGI